MIPALTERLRPLVGAGQSHIRNDKVCCAVGRWFLGCSGTDPLRWALALVADLTVIHLLETEAASRFLMPSFLTTFPTSGGLTHRIAP